MKFLIAGDSWGCGEWDKDCNFNPHRGLEQYLREDGHEIVANLSHQGISNHDIYQRLDRYIQRSSSFQCDAVIVLQTEYNRDYKHSAGWESTVNANDWISIQEPEDISSRWISRFYQNLSGLSRSINRKIYIIGGHSDALWFDDMGAHYPGCEIICQSMTNLILSGDHRINEPVLSFYESKTEELVKEIKSRLDSQNKIERLLSLMDKGYQREMLLRENPEYFYPDGIHPNRRGIRIVYDFLKEKYFQ